MQVRMIWYSLKARSLVSLHYPPSRGISAAESEWGPPKPCTTRPVTHPPTDVEGARPQSLGWIPSPELPEPWAAGPPAAEPVGRTPATAAAAKENTPP